MSLIDRPLHRMTAVCAIALAGSLAAAQLPSKIVEGKKPTAKQASKMQQSMAERGRAFMQNKGQWDSRARFLARTRGMNFWVTNEGIRFDFYRIQKGTDSSGKSGQVVGMKFLGGGSGKVAGVKQQSIRTDFLRSGSNEVRGVPSFKEVSVKQIYPGISARYYFEKEQPRYDFVLAPGAEPSQIKLGFQGVNGLTVNAKEIVLQTSVGDVKQGELYAYQVIEGKKKGVSVEFVQQASNQVGFKLGDYDKSKTLVIDPLVYGSYYGGDDGMDEVRAIVSDIDGGVYMTGTTQAFNFPVIFGPYGFVKKGNTFEKDAFVGKFQGDVYNHDYAAYVGGALDDHADFIQLDQFGDVWIAGRTFSSDFPGNTRPNVMHLNKVSGTPSGGATFRLRYGATSTAPIPHNASPATVDLALEAFLGGGTVTVTNVTGSGTLSTGAEYRIELVPSLSQALAVDNALLGAIYAITKESDIFMIRFKQDAFTSLNPLPTRALYVGGKRSESLTGFRIVPDETPTAGDPVRFVVAGNNAIDSEGLLPEITFNTPTTTTGFFVRVNHTNAGGFVIDPTSQYVVSGVGNNVAGIDVDDEANVYVAGTAFGFGTTDTAADPSSFFTTPVIIDGYLREGRLLRNTDAYARKYNTSGAIVYSVLIGGNNNDSGLAVAADALGSAHVTGIARSFNFPRTRGVFGEVFSAASVVFISKLNLDASDLLYSTHMRTGNAVTPAGIAVDSRGIAHISGTMSSTNFFDYDLAAPPDPIDITDIIGTGSLPTTPDAIDNLYDQAERIGTDEGFLMSLNPSATGLVYSTYIGSSLNEKVFRPYVDKIGDVWVCGWTDTFRRYFMCNSTGECEEITTLTRLPNSHLTPLAFRPNPDPNGGLGGPGTTFLEVGFYESGDPAPLTIGTEVDRDGFVLRFRIGLPAISNIAFSPTTIAGGLGAFTTGTVVLSSPALADGALIQLTIPNTTAASFSPTEDLSSFEFEIPPGGTAGQFRIYSKQVSQSTPVDVKATYEGNFRVGRFTVTPWLQNLTMSPTQVVGGNNATGRVTLVQNAPAGGLAITLSTNRADLVSFPTVVVPAGTNTAAFTVTTQGVATTVPVSITASAAGVGRATTLTIKPANLASVTFNPPRITAGSQSTGTVTLNGKTGNPGFTVNLAVQGAPAGYTLNPTSLTFTSGQTSKTFTISTPFEASNISRTVVATRSAIGGYPASTAQGTLVIDASALIGFTIAPTSVEGGASATGTITLGTPAQSGGAVVNISVAPNNGIVNPPAQVVIPQGATTTTFQIPTESLLSTQVFNITATRGGTPITRSLTVTPSTLILDITPSTIPGGSIAVGTVTTSSAAPVGGFSVGLSSSNESVLTVPDFVIIPQGETSATFAVNTVAVGSDQDVDVTATLGTSSQTVTVVVTPGSLQSLTFNPNSVRGIQTTRCTIMMDGPAPAGGIALTLTTTNPAIAYIPANVTIPAGQSSITFTVSTRRVARTLSTVVTARTVGGQQVQGTLTVRYQ